jgi:hypothetical protein
MHYDTRWKVERLIPYVTGFYNWHHPSSHTIALGSIQPLWEINTRNPSAGKGRSACKAYKLTDICEPIVWRMQKCRHLTTLWVSMACYWDTFTFFYKMEILLAIPRTTVMQIQHNSQSRMSAIETITLDCVNVGRFITLTLRDTLWYMHYKEFREFGNH